MAVFLLSANLEPLDFVANRTSNVCSRGAADGDGVNQMLLAST